MFKKLTKIMLVFLLLLAILSSCALTNSSEGNDTTPNNPATDPTAGEGAENNTSAPPEESHLATMDIESYIIYFVNYFHAPYDVTGKIEDDDILSLVFHFCYINKNVFDFVETNETDPEMSVMYIQGEEFRKTAKLLLGDSFDALEYHDFFNSGETADRYSIENDTYIVPAPKTYWGGDLYYLEFGVAPEITETEDEALVIASVYTEEEPPVKMEYKFKKIVDDGFLFYQIISVGMAK